GTEHLRGMLQARGDQLRRFDQVVLDVDHAEPESDARVEVAEGFELVITAAREFQHQVIDLEPVEERHQVFPEAFLDGLSAVISEADMQSALAPNAIEHMIERSLRPLPIFRVS